MEDILKSIKAYLYERISSPLSGTVIFSWLIWNYRFVMILIADKEIEQKFHLISNHFSTDYFSFFGFHLYIPAYFINGFLAPLTITLFYIYAYPFASEYVYEWSLRRQTKLRKIKQEESKQQLLSAAESNELFKRIADLQERYDSDIGFLRKQNSSLSKEISDLQTTGENNLPKVNNNKPDSFLSIIEMTILKAVNKSTPEDTITSTTISESLVIPSKTVIPTLAKLEELGFIHEIDETWDNESIYELTTEGKKHIQLN
jgi:DNA-binding MarR family transcriptional regulator